MRYMSLHAVAVVMAVLLPPLLATETRTADDAPAQVAESIVTACNDKRYRAVEERLHSWLRSTWVAMGYKVEDYCALLT